MNESKNQNQRRDAETQSKPKNPWARSAPKGWPVDEVQICDAGSRSEEIQKTDDPQVLRAMIAWPDTQKTVRATAERRLRKLTKPAAVAKVYEAEVRLAVFARVFIAATSLKDAKAKLSLPQTQWGGRIDYEDQTARVDSVQVIKEVQWA
jgi:hypothetical protein